ncbi:CHAT domain-containing protein [Dactylonectria estremocensis]|uniref:CHAT domain-containing protein n=1 Tax=Dactylonectria estremocensis TaxID=1079267 RepID=A0A9P9E6K0_9HYPO|nr:CHAT domain-containing protein [Dactylonectria estremocensis]
MESVSTEQLERAAILIGSQQQDEELIPDGQFCRDKHFLKRLDPDTLKFIYTVMLTERSTRARHFSMASESALMRDVVGRDQSGLKDAATLGALAVFNVLKSDPMRGVVVSMFGRVLRRQWEVASPEAQPVALDQAIEYLRKAVKFGPQDHPNRASHNDDLGEILTQRYKVSHSADDYEEATKAFNKALDTDLPGRPIFHFGLGKLQREKALFETKLKGDLLLESLSTFQVAINSIGSQFDSAPFRYTVADIFRARAVSFVDLYDLNNDSEDLKKAKVTLDEALTVCESRRPKDRFNCLVDLAAVLQRLSDDGDVEAAASAIDYWRQALRVYPNSVKALTGLADALKYKSDRSRNQGAQIEPDKLLARMSELQITGAVAETPFRLAIKATEHAETFKRIGSLEEIDKSIKCLQDALNYPELRGFEQADFSQLLSTALLLRFEVTEHQADLAQACRAAMEALTLLPDLTPSLRARCIWASGKTAFVSSQIPGWAHFIDGAITSFLNAKEAAPKTDSIYPTIANDLGNAFIVKCQSSSEARYLSDATQAFQEGLETLRAQGSPRDSTGEVMYLHGLANAALFQFRFSGRLEDINTAINIFEKCLDPRMTDPADVRAGSRTHSLSHALQLRYDMMCDKGDLLKAGQIIEELLSRQLNLAPVNNSALHNMLGAAYLRQYHDEKELRLLTQAQENFERALSCGCIDKSYIYSAKMNLTRTLQYRANLTNNLQDLIAALTHYNQCFMLVGIHSITLGTLLINQAELLISVWMVGPPELKQSAATAYLMMSTQFSAAPGMPRHVLAWAKTYAAVFAHLYGKDSRVARNFIREAAEDLPFAVLACSTRADQLRQAKTFQFVPTLALSFSIAAGDSLVEAIQLYEGSRCILWEGILDKAGNADLDALQEKFPHLAKRFIEGRDAGKLKPKIDVPLDGSMKLFESQTTYSRSTSFQELMQEIRTKEGFQDFLRLPREDSHFHELAGPGAIVILELDLMTEGYALIVTSETVQKVTLPGFTAAEAREHKALLRDAINLSGDEDDEHGASLLHYLLTWLWDVVAEPVMLGLGYTGNSEKADLPRVWWLTTSATSNWPIHAAGDHRRAAETGEPCTVLDRCIPSYTNTLRALAFVRQRQREIVQQEGVQQAMLVKMQTTDHREPLKHAAAEVDDVDTVLREGRITTKILDRPTRREALVELLKSRMAHFACHGEVDIENPVRSGLLLRDWWTRNSNGDVARGNVLDVQSMMSAPRQLSCSLVYISACETAVTGDPSLPEESIHLAAGFQMAGVPCVVGSLWKAEDETAGRVSKAFYQDLLKSGEALVTGERSAKALRLAVLKERQRGVDPRFWSTWVHYGP